jgi:hypothetical protein
MDGRTTPHLGFCKSTTWSPSSLSIFFSILQPKKANWREFASLYKNNEWSSEVVSFSLRIRDLFSSSYAWKNGVVEFWRQGKFEFYVSRHKAIIKANTMFICNSFYTTICTTFWTKFLIVQLMCPNLDNRIKCFVMVVLCFH